MASHSKTVSFRCDPILYSHLQKVQRESPHGLSSWIRSVLAAAAYREFPIKPTAPWEVFHLPDDSTIAIFHGDSRSLPIDLLNQKILVVNAIGMTRYATVKNVRRRSSQRVVVDIDPPPQFVATPMY